VSGSDLFAPQLLLYELVTVAWKKALREPDRRPEIEYRLGRALTSEIRLLAVDPVEVLDLAIRNRLTGYDASYLWVARDLNLPLASFDKELIRAAADLT
jgi:predicted nucleic acid-binding protein